MLVDTDPGSKSTQQSFEPFPISIVKEEPREFSKYSLFFKNS